MTFRFSEDFVSYSVLRALQAARWTILHYHPPGGQAGLQVRFSDGMRFTPDIVAAKHQDVLTIESKRHRSTADEAKLTKMRSDHEVAAFLRCFSGLPQARLIFAHAFGDKSEASPTAFEIRVRQNGCVHFPTDFP